MTTPTADQDASSLRQQKSSRANEQPPLPESWDRCHAYLPKKKKYCRQLPVPKKNNDSSTSTTQHQYCGNHLYLSNQQQTDHFLENQAASSRQWIPCPLDPTHSIYQDQLTKHLNICPKRRQQQHQEASYYYSQSINENGHGKLQSSSRKDMTSTSNDNDNRRSLQWAQRLALRVLEVHQKLFATTTESHSPTVPVRNLRCQDIVAAIPTLDLSGSELEDGKFQQAIEDYHIRSGGWKHVQQQASLIGHLRRLNVFSFTEQQEDLDDDDKVSEPLTPADPSRLILELGAGRGMTGLMAAGVAKAATTSMSTRPNNKSIEAHVGLVLVERNGARSKADTILRKAKYMTRRRRDYVQLLDIGFARIQCDLGHVNIAKVLEKEWNQQHSDNQRNVVVLAKHLCGAGTDLALKSIVPVKDRVSACVMATCCHGVCNWNDYVGRDYLISAMQSHDDNFVFGDSEFNMLCVWSAGTVSDMSDSAVDVVVTKKGDDDNVEEENDHPSTRQFSHQPRQISFKASELVASLGLQCGTQGLGRACQRLIDYGRLQFIRNDLFPQTSHSCDVVHYVSTDVTPQNAALVASNV